MLLSTESTDRHEAFDDRTSTLLVGATDNRTSTLLVEAIDERTLTQLVEAIDERTLTLLVEVKDQIILNADVAAITNNTVNEVVTTVVTLCPINSVLQRAKNAATATK